MESACKVLDDPTHGPMPQPDRPNSPEPSSWAESPCHVPAGPQPVPLFPLGRIAAASGAGRRQEHSPTPMAGIEPAPAAGPDSEPDNSEGEQASDTQSSAQQAGDDMALDCASHVSICDEPRQTLQGITDTANLAVGVGGVSSLLNPESRIQAAPQGWPQPAAPSQHDGRRMVRLSMPSDMGHPQTLHASPRQHVQAQAGGAAAMGQVAESNLGCMGNLVHGEGHELHGSFCQPPPGPTMLAARLAGISCTGRQQGAELGLMRVGQRPGQQALQSAEGMGGGQGYTHWGDNRALPARPWTVGGDEVAEVGAGAGPGLQASLSLTQVPPGPRTRLRTSVVVAAGGAKLLTPGLQGGVHVPPFGADAQWGQGPGMGVGGNGVGGSWQACQQPAAGWEGRGVANSMGGGAGNPMMVAMRAARPATAPVEATPRMVLGPRPATEPVPSTHVGPGGCPQPHPLARGPWAMGGRPHPPTFEETGSPCGSAQVPNLLCAVGTPGDPLVHAHVRAQQIMETLAAQWGQRGRDKPA